MDIYVYSRPFIHMKTIATIYIACCRQLKLCHNIFLSFKNNIPYTGPSLIMIMGREPDVPE